MTPRRARSIALVCATLSACRPAVLAGVVSDPLGARDASLDDDDAAILDVSAEGADRADAAASVDLAPDEPPRCAPDEVICDGRCARLDTAENCGRCGMRCAEGDACTAAGCGRDFRDVAVGDSHVCVVRVSGAAECMNWNSYGQLGDGTTMTRMDLRPVLNLRDAASIAAGQLHTCALRDGGGQVLCWGYNNTGQLGDGTLRDSPIPTEVQGFGRARGLGVGTYFSCAIKDTGEVFCWGANRDGALGTGDARRRLFPERGALGLTGVSMLGCGEQHACAVQDRTVWCWGNDERGQLGQGRAGSTTLMPVRVIERDHVLEVGCGATHTCARDEAGFVWCWGSNNVGELGDPFRAPSATPLRVAGIENVRQLAVAPGRNFSCALDGDGRVWCWGDNSLGQLGRGYATPLNMPEAPGVVALGEHRVRAVRAGGSQACAITDGGRSLWCWGHNGLGSGWGPTPVLVESSR